MIERIWDVEVIGQAKKYHKNLSTKAKISFASLLKELIELGPYRVKWSHYTKEVNANEKYHCHLNKGKPTYVVCWRIVDKHKRIIEVYYAGTHENAPY